MMKKVISLILALTFIFALTGCTKANKNRVKYNLKLEKFVTLCEYKGIKIDTKGEEYTKTYDELMKSDVESYGLYEKKTEGKLEKGDVANIDFEGKLNGVAFEGGTSKGYDLELGSGSFIDGFEDKLIGVKIGATVDLDLKFPENYGNEELNGKAVVFTVKVNYVTTKTALKPEVYYKDIGYETVDEYYAKVKERTLNKILLTKVLTDSKVEKYPADEKKLITEQGIKTFEANLMQYYGDSVTLKDYLSANGQTEDEFNEYVVTNYAEPIMEEEMVIYAIFDDAGFKMDEKELAESTKKEVASYKSDKVTEKTLKEQYGEDYFEYLYIQEKVVKYLNDNAKIS
ncbi:MAG: FKBP-type peptidyl-prolyl cis-trans isomerase [Clostridia bacterium]|nr:FKBP-type peptidyl-prolyl cis-trans isomerase [Clostridia bacterium]